MATLKDFPRICDRLSRAHKTDRQLLVQLLSIMGHKTDIWGFGGCNFDEDQKNDFVRLVTKKFSMTKLMLLSVLLGLPASGGGTNNRSPRN